MGRIRVSAAPYQNGTKDRVLAAIRNGCGTVPDIMRRTGFDRSQVENAIKRLKDAGDIRRKNLGGYEATASRCLLAEVWA